MADPELWCRITVTGPCGLPIADWRLQGDGRPDLDAVNRLARLRVAAARAGATVELADISAELAELLELVGLGALRG